MIKRGKHRKRDEKRKNNYGLIFKQRKRDRN